MRTPALLLFSSLLFSAAGSASAQTVIMQKQGTGFAIDGNRGTSQAGRQVYLWNTDARNVNQQWIEISRGSNTFSYQKNNTSLCLDGGNGGANRQPIVLQSCSSSNQNQQWRKISTGGNSYRLEKRNASGFSIDGNNGADFRQGIYLWGSNSNNVNQQWEFFSSSSNIPTVDVVSSNDSGSSSNNSNSSNNSSSSGDFGLDPNAEPWENFDLSDWVIDTPAFASDGESERFGERDWDDISRDSENFFFTHSDGGMRFVTRLDGARTSQNTSFVRSELREMLRRGNESISTRGANGNNWALGYQPGNTDHGGRNGLLTATLRVNKVTTTGDGIHVGRTIIGQIHASSDEPLRLYYHKYPNDSRGCIYVESEIRDGDDVNFGIIGNEDCDNPSNGIALNELFSYEISNDDDELEVRIRRGDRDGPTIGQRTIDMERIGSDYDRSDEWMYFKAGAYTQNNTGNDSDGDIITFYRLENTHDNN